MSKIFQILNPAVPMHPRNQRRLKIILVGLGLVLFGLCIWAWPALADGTTLPGDDASAKMESAGTLLRFIDTGVFKWSARILAGICIVGSAWNLKEARIGAALLSVVAALLLGTAPSWVKNIFAVGGSDSVFTMSNPDRYRQTGEENSRHA